MPNVDQVKQQVFNIYQALDQLQAILPVMAANYRVSVPGTGVDSPLPPDRVQAIKDQYVKLRAQIASTAAQIAPLESLG